MNRTTFMRWPGRDPLEIEVLNGGTAYRRGTLTEANVVTGTGGRVVGPCTSCTALALHPPSRAPKNLAVLNSYAVSVTDVIPHATSVEVIEVTRTSVL